MRLLLIGLAIMSSVSFGDTITTIAGKKATGYLGLIGPGGTAPIYEAMKAREDLPEAFDWREHAIVSSIKDQGNCGSCYSFAITKAFESALALKAGTKLDLAEQEIVSCSGAYKCGGGFMSTAGYVVTHGQGLESDFPYTASNARCKKIAVAAKAASYKLLGSSTKKPTVAEMKTAMMEHGPLFVTVSAGGSGWSGSTGMITGCKNRSTNHMVNLVGWYKDGWIMANSWSSNWGDKGFTKMPFGCDKIGDEAGYIVVDQVE